MARADSSSSFSAAPSNIVSGTRTRVYQQEEHLVMINRDKFDALESVISDRSLFTHFGTALLTFGLTLGIEMGLTYRETEDAVAFSIFVFCCFSSAVGIGAFVAAWRKHNRYKNVRAGLFDDQNLLSDQTVINTASGDQKRIDHLATTGSR